MIEDDVKDASEQSSEGEAGDSEEPPPSTAASCFPDQDIGVEVIEVRWAFEKGQSL